MVRLMLLVRGKVVCKAGESKRQDITLSERLKLKSRIILSHGSHQAQKKWRSVCLCGVDAVRLSSSHLHSSISYIYIPQLNMSTTRPSPVLSHALPLPILQMLQHRRVVLASSSPRRKDILEVAVCFSCGGH